MMEIGAVKFFRDPLVVVAADIQALSKTNEIVLRSKAELWHRTHPRPALPNRYLNLPQLCDDLFRLESLRSRFGLPLF
jgi:hypothetical protein